MSELTGEAEEDAMVFASGVNERDHRTIPPVKMRFCTGMRRG